LNEVFRLILFFIVLSMFSVFLVQFRLEDKAYTYADAGIQISTLEEIHKERFFWEEYKNFLSRVFTIHGGHTQSGEPVYRHIFQRLVPTFQLSLFALLSGVFLSIVLTLELIHFPKILGVLDVVSKSILSTPVFIFSVLLLLVFFYKLEILPPGGYKPGDISYLILPGASLGMRVYARLQLFLSQSYKNEKDSAYFLLLRSRGLPRRVIVYRHFLVKIFPTLFVLIVLDLGSLLSGAMVVEEIFFYPGIGRSLYYSIKSMDGELLQVLILYSGMLFYLLNRIAILIQRQILEIDRSA